MYKALIEKELREMWWMAVLALLPLGYYVLFLMGYNHLTFFSMRPVEIPFVSDSFHLWFACTASSLAAVLGLWQSVSESTRGTWPFLAHRPLSRRRMLATKMATGLALLLVATPIPIIIYGIWSATPGTHASPFRWSMTADAWLSWWAATAIYLAAFLSGLRPARWYASRLLPLIGIALLVSLIQIVAPWTIASLWWSSFIAVLLFDAVLVFTVFHEPDDLDFA